MMIPRVNDSLVNEQINLANFTNKPLYLILIATKPCYIKLASLILALNERHIPFLAIDVGQHFDKDLIGAQHELHYQHLISIFLNVRGDLLERTCDLADKISWLVSFFQARKLREQAIPVVSGDTSTAGMFPVLWYLKTSARSIHVEAGLRSLSPFADLEDHNDYQGAIILQRSNIHWQMIRDEPFPEGIDSRLASVCSQLFFAPVSINGKHLLNEGVVAKDIYQVGSLSADAIRLVCQEPVHRSVFEIYPFLKNGTWIRIDIHRRENMDLHTLHNILKAVAQLASRGFSIVIVLSNALSRAIELFGLQNELKELLKYETIKITPLWPNYRHVIEFFCSGNCLGIYTDSGGLQEETQILDIPCVTCRYSTDRPETVMTVRNNILVPPFSAEFISKSLEYIYSNQASLFSNKEKKLYSTNVGAQIAEVLYSYSPKSLPVARDIFDNRMV
jgi:UDP-N-acetylglucosamine 2-epimerase (non-hydrolysing)